MTDKYILDEEGNPKPATLHEWASWFETAERRVADTKVGETHISTVFLGLDHSFGQSQKPLLWETMIFGGEHDGYQERYTSRADAEAGHAHAVSLAQAKKP